MVKINKLGIILSPTENEFENNGALNPGIYQDGNIVHILYRAVKDGNVSTVGYAKAEGAMNIIERREKPLIDIEFEYESHGVEDVRLVKIEDVYYLTYTAYDGVNAMGALATSKDLITFEKHGIITPRINFETYKKQIAKCSDKLNPKYHDYEKLFDGRGLNGDDSVMVRDKDLVFFPKKINGKFAMLHRIWCGIQIAYFDKWEDLTDEYWKDHMENLADNIILDPKEGIDIHYIGAGGAPIETEDGWLLIYHGVQKTKKGNVYHAKVALLDINDPKIIISELDTPIFSPTETWELDGVVNDVVFPTGHSLFGDDLYVYYGAADKHTAVAQLNINELLAELKNDKWNKRKFNR